MNKKELEAKTIQTYDADAKQWSASHTIGNGWQAPIEKLKKLLPGGRIIEVGCGGGRDAAALIKAGYAYVGTDASAGMIGVAAAEVPGAVFQQLSVYDLRRLQTQFDGFWACAVLLHVPKARIDEALQALGSVLKPDAIGMISMKDGDREDFEVRDKNGAHQERLFVYWTKDAFTKKLAENGFSVLHYDYRPVSVRTKWHIFFVQKTVPAETRRSRAPGQLR